jgi:hypothetical protein
MAQTPQILGQNLPTAGVDTTLATVPNGFTAQISVYICNQAGNIDTFSIALVPDAQVFPPIDQPYNYIAYNTPILGNSVFAYSSLYLNSGDRIQIISTNGTSSFTATGIVFS